MAELSALFQATLTAFLVLVLTRAALHKALDFRRTLGFAQAYRAAPEHWVPALLRMLAAAEAVAIAALLLAETRMAGATLAALLFAGYLVLMARALARGQTRIDCGCGGAPQQVSALTLGRNAVLVGLCLAVAALASQPGRPIDAGGAAVSIAAALLFFAILGVGEKLAAHLPHIRQNA